MKSVKFAHTPPLVFHFFKPKKAILLLSLLLLLGCQTKQDDIKKAPTISATPNLIECPETRSQMCTREYRPVCAKRDIGVRCIKSPCPSSELVTKPNACVACADKNIFAYSLEACPKQ